MNVFQWILVCLACHHITTTQPQLLSITDEGCDVTKQCLHYPDNCQSDCEFFLSWMKSVDGKQMIFEMKGVVDSELSGAGWVALGLSSDRRMGDDFVIHCINDPASNEVIVATSLNIGESNLPYTPAVFNFLSVHDGYYDGGYLFCKFSRPISGDGDKAVDLNKLYYVLLARGPALKDTLRHHRSHPYVSRDPIDLTSVQVHSSQSFPQCGVSAGCYNDRRGNNVTFVVENEAIKFEISGFSSGYVALGLSYDIFMGTDSVVECIRRPDGTVTVQRSFDVGSENKLVGEPTGLTVHVARYENGILSCSFSQQISSVGNLEVFDLNQSYYLLLATGDVTSNGLKVEHRQLPTVSSARINLLADATVDVGRKSTNLKQAHACLMITAWVLFSSAAIIMVRYYRPLWPERKICNLPVWFATHRSFMVMALLLTAAGFIIIFVDQHGRYVTFSPADPQYFWAHAPIGIVVMILVIINPLIALFRCKPKTKHRPIFNWLHFTVGTSCHVLAYLTIFFGVGIGELSDPEERICHPAIFWLLIGSGSLHLCSEGTLSIAGMIHKRMSHENDPVEMELSSSVDPPTNKRHSSDWNSTLHYVVLAIYSALNTVLWLTMVILIGSRTIV